MADHPTLVLNSFLVSRLTLRIVARLMHCEGIVLDIQLSVSVARWHERLLIDLADRLALLVPHDVPVPDLLVDRRVVDQSTGHRLLHLLGLLQGVSLCRSRVRAHDALVHPLEIIIAAVVVLAQDSLGGGVPTNDVLLGRDRPVALRAVHGGTTAEG